MTSFPTLKSGAVAQYPLAFVNAQAVRLVRFMDGTDQRFLAQGKQFRRWQIRLELLDENELHQVEMFFASQQGTYSVFAFPDPFTGSNVPNCRIGIAELNTQYTGVDAGSAALWVIETNG